MSVDSAATREVWRLFVAIDLPDDVRRQVARVAERLAEAGWRAKWVRPEATHLTLKFYGNVDLDRVPALGSGLEQAASTVAPFNLMTTAPGVFPNPRRPRVIWLGVGGQTAALDRLAGAVERVSEALGFPPEERAFHPHITVGRIRPEERQAAGDLGRHLEGLAGLPKLAIPVDRITLFRSELRRTGAIYTVVEEFPLGDRTR